MFGVVEVARCRSGSAGFHCPVVVLAARRDGFGLVRPVVVGRVGVGGRS